jgi:hypothetical protein
MPTKSENKEALSDLKAKVANAKEAVNADEAGEREKADLKLLEQEATAEKMKAKRPKAPSTPAPGDVEAKLDKALKDSFPGSDPVSFVEAAPIKQGDRALDTVPSEEPKLKH